MRVLWSSTHKASSTKRSWPSQEASVTLKVHLWSTLRTQTGGPFRMSPVFILYLIESFFRDPTNSVKNWWIPLKNVEGIVNGLFPTRSCIPFLQITTFSYVDQLTVSVRPLIYSFKAWWIVFLCGTGQAGLHVFIVSISFEQWQHTFWPYLSPSDNSWRVIQSLVFCGDLSSFWLGLWPFMSTGKLKELATIGTGAKIEEDDT